ncbi:MAG: hypothetical protein K6G73_10045 [Marinilabiliaceae bacterium]|nr:hypothetical protein [Marinilabiliaceae bacterium]
MNRIIMIIITGMCAYGTMSCSKSNCSSNATPDNKVTIVAEEASLSTSERLMVLLSEEVELNDSLCYSICYAMKTSDASTSEQLGYVLYNYFKGNNKRNDYINSFVSQNNINKKEFSILFLKCIDLENEYENYDELINAFPMLHISKDEYKELLQED